MSRSHSQSPGSYSTAMTPGDPGPSSLSSLLSPLKRKRSESRDLLVRDTTHSRRSRSPIDAATPRYSGRREDKVKEEERDELESDSGSTSPSGGGGWSYQLEIVQQPQRARACGFGDKDRRPLSPPPILRLWIRDSSGQLVDPSHVSVNFLVLIVDLWSADGEQHRNVVMHPASQSSSRDDSPPRAFSEHPSRPSTAPSRDPPTMWPASGYGQMPGPSYPPLHSPGTSPRSRLPLLPSTSTWTQPGQDVATSRPSSHAGRTLPRTMPSISERIRPTTAPSHHLQRPNIQRKPLETPASPSYALPPISSITLRERDEGTYPRMTLPAMNDRPYSRETHSSSSSNVISHDYHYSFGRPTSSSSSVPWFHGVTPSDARHKDSVSTVASDIVTPSREAGPPFDRPLTGTDRPVTGYGSDRPSSSSYDRPFSGYEKTPTYMWERPITAGSGSGSHVAFETVDHDRERDPRGADHYLPSGPHMPRLSNASHSSAPQAHFSRVLVGSLCTACQRLQDEHGQTGLFFFAHDLGVRTEGTFTLKFTLTDLTSLMRRSVMPGAKVSVLATALSTPFTVYSAKRFPGVIPTTELTRHFAKQGVRLPTRQKRAVAGGSDNECDDD